jgi:prophage antirepressor-like protein
MNHLAIFDFQDHVVRVVDRNDQPWFVASDICRVLGIANSRDAVSSLEDDERNTVGIADGNRGNPNTTVISESGLYSLVFKSRKPEAKVFRRWVTSEVLPSIRQAGGYAHRPRQLDLLPAVRMAIQLRDSGFSDETIISMCRPQQVKEKKKVRQQLELPNDHVWRNVILFIELEMVQKEGATVRLRDIRPRFVRWTKGQHGPFLSVQTMRLILTEACHVVKIDSRNYPTLHGYDWKDESLAPTPAG